MARHLGRLKRGGRRRTVSRRYAGSIETLGTRHTEPRAPTAELAEYFDWLARTQRWGKWWARWQLLDSSLH